MKISTKCRLDEENAKMQTVENVEKKLDMVEKYERYWWSKKCRQNIGKIAT